MPVGRVARRLLGSKFRYAGEAYRSLFVDMRKVVDAMIEYIPAEASVLDIGGGDGFVVNLLLERLPKLRVTMTDLAENIGTFIDERHRDRVAVFPGTDFNEVQGDFAAVTITDVVHHVPQKARASFFASIGSVAAGRTLIVKDVEPGYLRSYASLASDWYVTGDKGVSLVSREAMRAHLAAVLPDVDFVTSMPDPPNYLVVARPRT